MRPGKTKPCLRRPAVRVKGCLGRRTLQFLSQCRLFLWYIFCIQTQAAWRPKGLHRPTVQSVLLKPFSKKNLHLSKGWYYITSGDLFRTYLK